MKKIKILRMIARLNIGGPAIHTIILTGGLDNSRFESLLVYGSIDTDEADMLYYAPQKNIKTIFIPELKHRLNLLNDAIAFKKIYNIIKNEQPDIIHTHTAKAGALGRLAGIMHNISHPFKSRKIKLIHTFHGHVFSGYFNKFKTKMFILIERFLAFFTHKIITVSGSIKDQLVSLNISNENKIRVIPLGFELDKFLDITARNNNTPNVGIVGRLVPIKNHRLFLESAFKITQNNPGMKIKFKIIGNGQERWALERYAHKLGILKEVEFLGWQKDLVKVYSDLDVVALTSNNEGTPVSLIEAMASGKIVVATDVGGIRDLLGEEIDARIKPQAVDFRILERGVIVNPGDSSSFASAIIFILQNNELKENLEREARNFVKERFTKDRLVRDIENLYNGILA